MKSLRLSLAPLKRTKFGTVLAPFQKVTQWSRYLRIVVDKSAKEIHKTQEDLDFMMGRWSRPRSDSVYPPFIHRDASGTNHKP